MRETKEVYKRLTVQSGVAQTMQGKEIKKHCKDKPKPCVCLDTFEENRRGENHFMYILFLMQQKECKEEKNQT